MKQALVQFTFFFLPALLICIISSAQIRSDTVINKRVAPAIKNNQRKDGAISPAPYNKSAKGAREFADRLVNETRIPETEAASRDHPQSTTSQSGCKDPYAICKKKIPAGTDFKKLIPESICGWKQIYYKAPAPGFDGEARFVNEKDSVFMLFSLQQEISSLKQVFNTIKKEAIETDNLISVADPPANPAWLKVGKGKHVFFAWTRDNYIFSCETLQGWPPLESFIKCFLY